MNGNKFATGEILGKPVEVLKERILAGWSEKSPEPCLADNYFEIFGTNEGKLHYLHERKSNILFSKETCQSTTC
jgi:hypothetical protein